jgi:tetratricopeptide (TPR) repeat protein
VSSEFSEEYQEVGQTPVDVKLKDIASKDNFAYLSFQAEGYQKHRVILPSKYSSGSVEIKLEKLQDLEELKARLQENFETQLSALKEQMQQQRADYVARIESEQRLYNEEKNRMEVEFQENSLEIFNRVIEVQNALHMKRMAKAAKALAELRSYPAPESLLLTLEGNFEFINGRVRRALASYQRALDLDPTNVELEGILRKLKRVSQ